MRRSGAPSFRNTKRKIEQITSSNCKEVHANHEPKSKVNLAKRLKGEKLAFNIVWREKSTKKHKTWRGNGILEVQLERNRAVITDDTGKYLGSADKFDVSDLREGFQMNIGNKEIEVLEQIVDQNEYWLARKTQVENRGWGSEEWMPMEERAKVENKAISKMTIPELSFSSSQISKSKTPKEQMFTLPIRLTKTLVTDNSSRTNFSISEHLAKILRPHQLDGVSFLYRCLMGYSQQGDYYGCILADEMGLGKTLQVLTVANSLLRYSKPTVVHRVLIVAPRTLVTNWNNEINKWLEAERMYGFIVDGSCAAKNRRKLSAYAKQSHVPFVIVSYETLISQLQDFEALNCDLLICDEGHRIKNPATKTYKTLQALNIKRRVLLTGTPVQNVLSEFYALADFVNPGILGTRTEFDRHFEKPIELGQQPQASSEVKALADERSTELRTISSTFLLRRLQDVNLQHLPAKREYICFLCPSKLQHMLLRKVSAYYNERKESNTQDCMPLEMLSLLRKICDHPCLVKHSNHQSPLMRTLARHVSDLYQLNSSDSSKLLLVQNLLTEAVNANSEKVVLISYHTKTLDVLQKLCDCLQINYLRLDGTTSTSERNTIVSTFNASNANLQTDAFVLLLSAKAGGVGLNLIGASRLVLYDIDWNPANDAQALSRIWREGQQRDVHIYRLVTAGCIEEKIFKRQIKKTNLGEFLSVKENATLNGAKTSMKFTAEELKDLFDLQYNFNECDTHQHLECECIGNGQNLDELTAVEEVKQFNELSGWKHWKPSNAGESFLRNACLWGAKDEIVYIFSNETVNTAPNLAI